MATLHAIKPAFQAVLRPAVALLARTGATPNGVTLAALGLSLLYGLLLAVFPGEPALLYGLPGVLVLRLALNAVDGLLAREHGQASRLGGRLNEIGDVLADLALYLPLALVLAPGWAVAVAVLTGVLTEFCGVLGQAHGGVRRNEGPLGKADRALAFGALAVAQAATGLPPALVLLASGLAVAAAVLTCARRLTGGLGDG